MLRNVSLLCNMAYDWFSCTLQGSIEERDIIRTTSKSRIAIFNEKQKEIATMKTNEKNCDLISYTVSIDCAIIL